MPRRAMAMATRRRPVQARRVRRFEMERPSMVAVINEGAAWTTVNTQRLPGLALALASLALLAFLFSSPQFLVYEAQVTGNQLLSAEQVYRASEADAASVFFLSPQAVEARLLEALPVLDRARVTVSLPALLHIDVAEKKARIVWEVGGQAFLADAQGLVMGAGSVLPDALHIRASEVMPPAEGQQLDAAVVETALSLSELLGGARSFDYSPRQGIVWRTEQGWPVSLGVGGDLTQKVAVMRTVLAELVRQGIKPEFLDVSVPARPYYR